MRVLLKAILNTEKTNEVIRDGTMQKSMQAALESLRPEAAYFTTEEGCRTAFIVFDLADPSQMPKFAEPFFMEMGAKISVTPVMNREDLEKGLAALG
uniref:GYD domain-containing protein n=1 Tax=Streptomyces sp. NBC_00003 TaxID=2903608 RepID=A0AAU2UWP3_9ACTN